MVDHIAKFLRKLSPDIREKLLNKIEEIEIKGLSAGDIKPYQDIKGAYRVRIGKIRMVFILKDKSLEILKIGFRGDIY